MAKKSSVYLSDTLLRVIGPAGDDYDVSVSGRLNQIGDRYAQILRRTQLPELSEAELNLIRDALNDVLHEPADMIRGAIGHGVSDSIALDGLAEKWSVDGEVLVEKLAALDYAQEVTLLERVEQWWRQKR